MTVQEAIDFVRRHGVVLESAPGAVPNLAEAIAGAPIRGSRWSHPRGRDIFKLTRAVRGFSEVPVCRWIGGKITFVHRRLWPALVCLAGRIPHGRLAQVRELHTPSGRHALEEVPVPKWVSASLSRAAARLDEVVALRMLSCLRRQSVRSRTGRSRRGPR